MSFHLPVRPEAECRLSAANALPRRRAATPRTVPGDDAGTGTGAGGVAVRRGAARAKVNVSAPRRVPDESPRRLAPRPLLPPAAVHYPDSDGQPLAESDFQLKPLVYAYTALAGRYRDRDDVYVSADLFVYYEQGNPRAVVAPDVFVVLGAPGHDRRTYKLWEEPKAPDFVLEITSHTTRAEDEGTKRRVYARLGVREYWRFDPTGDWLDPPLKGNGWPQAGAIWRCRSVRRRPARSPAAARCWDWTSPSWTGGFACTTRRRAATSPPPRRSRNAP